MPSIVRENDKWIVRAEAGEWKFDTHSEAQQKANEEMFKEAKKKGLL